MIPPGETVPDNRWDLLDGRWPARPPQVSVIVVHYRQPASLDRTLRALADQTHPAQRTEVIVVDDGSPVAPVVGPGVRLLCQEDRGARPGTARNLGAAAATGEILCFLDADTAPEPEYLRRLSRLPALAPEAVTVGRRRHTALPPGAPLSQAHRHELPEPAWLRDGYAASRDLRDADDRSYRFVISAVLGCSRWFFDEVGPFAEFDEYGGEDWEWAHRAWRAGAILAHVADAVAWHDGPDWSGRTGAGSRRAEKNAETLRLTSLIGVPGSRGRGLRPARAETVVRVADAGTPSQAFRCVDGLLDALPDAAIVVAPAAHRPFAHDGRVVADGAEDAPALTWPALEIEVHRPVAVDPVALRAACREVRASGLSRLELTDVDGPLLTIADGRARRRARRWDERSFTERRTRDASNCARALAREPDLEGWVGGWAN